MATFNSDLLVISVFAVSCVSGCHSKFGQKEQVEPSDARLGLLPTKAESKPSVVDPLVELAKPVQHRPGGPSVSKDGTVVPTYAPPPELLLTMQAVTSYDEVWVYAEPHFHSEKLGFLRRGVHLKVTREQGKKGCSKGWFQLPGGGFACASKGLVVHEKTPFVDEQSKPPSRDLEFVTWARVVSPKTPMWWRLPTQKEWNSAQLMRKDWGHKPEPFLSGQPRPEAPVTDKPQGAVLSAQGPESQLPLSLATPWLDAGSFASLDRIVSHEGRRFWKTMQGGYVQENALLEVQTQDYQGQALASPTDFEAVAFVGPHRTQSNIRTNEGRWARGETIKAKTAVRVYEETDFAGKKWSRISDQHWVASDSLIRPTRASLPGGVESTERWIDVDLDKQVLVAYEGETPVYVTLVSSGQNRGEEVYETPTGVWRIYSKEKSSNMVESQTADSASFYQDVPWVMYFSGHLALRGSFWHEDLGRKGTTGSIDLGPSDARWLFSWTRPQVPLAWHGVLQSKFNPGTAISVRSKSPENTQSPDRAPL